MEYLIDTQDAPIAFEAERFSDQRILQNVKNLLRLRKGECPFDAQRGLDARLFYLPLAQAQEKLMPEIDRVLLWEPYAEALSAELYTDENGEMQIRALVEVNGE